MRMQEKKFRRLSTVGTLVLAATLYGNALASEEESETNVADFPKVIPMKKLTNAYPSFKHPCSRTPPDLSLFYESYDIRSYSVAKLKKAGLPCEDDTSGRFQPDTPLRTMKNLNFDSCTPKGKAPVRITDSVPCLQNRAFRVRQLFIGVDEKKLLVDKCEKKASEKQKTIKVYLDRKKRLQDTVITADLKGNHNFSTQLYNMVRSMNLFPSVASQQARDQTLAECEVAEKIVRDFAPYPTDFAPLLNEDRDAVGRSISLSLKQLAYIAAKARQAVKVYDHNKKLTAQLLRIADGKMKM